MKALPEPSTDLKSQSYLYILFNVSGYWYLLWQKHLN